MGDVHVEALERLRSAAAACRYADAVIAYDNLPAPGTPPERWRAEAAFLVVDALRILGRRSEARRIGLAAVDEAEAHGWTEELAGGLVKLGQMEWIEGDKERFAFSCGHAHDRLVGLLLVRALNVRGVEREEQMAAARGQLLAPSAQKQ